MPRAAGGGLKGLALLACFACPWLAHLAVSRGVAGPLPAILAVPHAAIYLFLLGLFGRTLVRGREALITAVARRIHGTLKPEIEAYTRRVTFAWCCFFAGQLAVSASLFAWAPLATWSLFVNVLNLPLLALMFAAEYGYRVTRYPEHPRASLAAMLKGFSGSALTDARSR